MSGFSSALKLTDLNDFIQPSQACIKPVQDAANQGPKDPAAAAAEDEGLIRINRKTNWKRNATKDEGDQGQVKPSETKTGTTPLNVTLGDCLACSGCITSAEAVLIAEQSHEKVFEILDAKNQSGPDSVPTLVVLSLSLQSLASLGAKSGLSIEQTARRLSHFFVQLGVDYVCDIALARHLCLVESAREFVLRHRQQKDQGTRSQVGPLLSSTCPGFVCYAEKSQGAVLVPLLSQVKSPQQIMGILVKKRLDLLVPRSSESLQSSETDSPKVYHITLMPCYDKKLEASRLENRIDPTSDGDPVPEVDCVITPIELEKMLEMRQVQSLADLPERPLDQIYSPFYELGSNGQKICSHLGSGTGGYAENLFRHVASELYHWQPDLSSKTSSLSWKAVRNADFLELNLYEDDGSTTTTGPSSGSADPLLSFAILNGFRNVQNLVSRLKRRACNYDYIEVSACPKGCLNGGAQLRPEGGSTAAEIFEQVQQLYDQLPITDYDLGLSEEEKDQPAEEIQLDQLSLTQMGQIRHKTDQLYRDLGIDQQLRKQMHTKFAAIPKSFNILNSNW